MTRQPMSRQSVRMLGGLSLLVLSCCSAPMETADCRMAAVCGAGTFCDSKTGSCRTGCSSAAECGSGESCDTGAHACYSTQLTITSVMPDPLPLNGGTLTVQGTNFHAGVGLAATLDGTTVQFTVVSANQLTIDAPAVVTCGTRMLVLTYPSGAGQATAPVRYGPCNVGFTASKITAPNAPTSNSFSSGKVQLADFNNDGNLDILFTNSETNTLYVYRGDGTGKFMAALTTATTVAPVLFTAVDYNKDGKIDVPLVDTAGNAIQLYNGSGSGTFTAGLRTSINNAIFARAPLPADFNGDGIFDLPVATSAIQMLFGSATAPFQLGQQYAVNNVTSLISGDFTKDGKPDLIGVQTMGMNSTVQFLRGNGDGTLAAPTQISTMPLNGVAGDFDRDGTLDLQVGGIFYRGNGDGTFTQGMTSFTNAESKAVADFNQDGALDVVVSLSFVKDATVFLGKGNGTFQSAGIILPSTDQVTSIAVGDLNKDGLTDVVIGNKPQTGVAQSIDIYLAASK